MGAFQKDNPLQYIWEHLQKETSDGKWCEMLVVVVESLCHIRLCDPMVPSPPGSSMGFPRQKYWSGLPFPPPGDLPHPGIKPASPALQADSLPTEPPGKPVRHQEFSL